MATLISVDVEADGPIPNLYSLVSLGAVVVDSKLDKTFYAETRPVSDLWVPEALAVSGFSREQHEAFEPPEIVMPRFAEWVKSVSKGRPIFIADNNGFDWQWINYYFHYYTGSNPFGFSSRRIGDLYCGMQKDAFAKWKHLRQVTHTHNALQDALGNATALLEMKKMGLKLPIK
jgi:DNA polymerase III epsilon subunit-like protein